MLPTVLLLLSVFTVRGSACDDLKRETVSNLQGSIEHEEQIGFLQVFPKNYYVQHHFNGSTQCEDSCCVFSAAFLLSDSWKQLLQHVERIHMKHILIGDLIFTLDNIWKESFQETPNPSVFPSFHSSPRALLTFTSDVLSKWLALDCPVEKFGCVFPSPAPMFTDRKEEQEKEHRVTDGELVEEESEYGKEGEREKRWLTVMPKNGDVGLSASPAFFLCILCCLRMLLDVILNELG
ncbi:uncharacterized protein zgc:174888 isoform X1 [Pangasianodon hypophthalmus]|uniref:uncharacterized protein zgc:174888 isoform X1 n=1 Tax=Pangasianodon hypophthalmus TaxID=310915 RepID=UPI002307B779|nr:uncharacterized protein zgc:174888 isoform X1 [Pangasianodon hypophthalmus]